MVKSVEEHLRDCRSLCVRRQPVWMSTLDASGHRLAETVRAQSPYPSFAASAMDGYAVRSADLPGRLRVVGDVPAGRQPDCEVGPGAAVRVMTGAPVPAGADAVVPVEDVSVADGVVDVAVSMKPGRNIRGVGDDVRRGDVVLEAGQRIGAPQLAALVAHNVVRVLVHPRPTVAVLSTGDELVAFGSDAGAAQLVDSNGPTIAAAARAAGADVIVQRRVGDDEATFCQALDDLPVVDLIVTSGGVSMGAYDVVKATLATRGVAFESVAMQPGKPQAWGRIDGTRSFLGLPGNPVSALVSFELFGRAALGAERPTVAATLIEDGPKASPGRRRYLRGIVRDGQVRLLGGTQSHLIVGMAQANCLVVMPEAADQLRAGSTVPVILLEC